MDAMFALLLAAGGGSIAYLIAWLVSQERGREWMKAAAAAGVANAHLSTFAGVKSKLKGTADGLDVTVENYRRGKYEHGTRITVGGLRHGQYGMTVRAEGVTSMVEKTFGEREIEIGDPAFDRSAYLQGSPQLARAVFDRDTRFLLRRLLGGDIEVGNGDIISKLRVSISNGELRVDMPATLLNDTRKRLADVLPAVLAIAHRLERPSDIAARIAANLAVEPEVAARLGDLAELVSEFAGHAATQSALEAALGDESAEVRLLAAVSLGQKGRATLALLAAGVAPDAVAAAAIRALGADFPATLAIRRLGGAKDAGRVETALACLAAIGREDSPEAVAALCSALSSDAETLAAGAASALGALGRLEAEGALIAALEKESSVIRTASAEALGRLATPAAVVPLREAAGSHPLDGAFRRAAREAIVQIQSRVSGASPGQLSLAADQSGQISLVGEETQAETRGRVSVAQAQAARSQTTSSG